MLSSVALHAGELLAAVLLAGTVCVAVMAAGAAWLRRRVRRRLAGLRPVLASRAAAMAGSSIGSTGSRWLWSLPVPDRGWREGSRARRELWRAVGAAEHAVSVARRGGAPTGDLDALCRRLRQAAGSADRRPVHGRGHRGAAAFRGTDVTGGVAADHLPAPGRAVPAPDGGLTGAAAAGRRAAAAGRSNHGCAASVTVAVADWPSLV
jgi:hypothetical protein